MEKMLFARLTDPEICGPSNRRMLREYWKDNAALLREVSDLCRFDGSPISFDAASLLLELSRILQDLSNGYVSTLIDAARNSGGGAPRRLNDRELIAPAVYFLRGVELGTVESRRPVAAVSEAYGVSKVTVRTWRETGDDIVDGIAPAHENLLEESMLYAGLRYRGMSAQRRGEPNF
jgi:hypothetical protein